MKIDDLKILGQLSPETQEMIEMRMTVKELFTYAGFISADEEPKPEERENGRTGERMKGITGKRKKGRKGNGKKGVTATVLPVLPVVTSVPVTSVPVVPEREATEDIETPDGSLYYTVKDVAEIYNVHLLTVYDWVRKGVLNAHHKNGKSMVFAKFDVVNLKRARGKR